MSGYVEITPFKCNGEITAPPSKSMAHRALICAYLGGNSEVDGIGSSVDVLTTLNALKAMGANFQKIGDKVVFGKFNAVESCVIDCRESGSTLRFLIPLCAALGIKATFTGSDRLINKRPNTCLLDALNQKGADIIDLTIHGRLKPSDYVIDGSVSSQYVSGLLFALSYLKNSTLKVVGKKVSENYVKMTIDALNSFGVKVNYSDDVFYFEGDFHPSKIVVEGDWSGAAAPIVFGAINGKVKINNLNVNSLQGDKRILEIVKEYGAKVFVDTNSVTVEQDTLNGVEVDCENIPDVAQIISVLGAFAKGKTVIKNVKRLSLKESDRVAGIIDTLTVAGIKAEKVGDDIAIQGGSPDCLEYHPDPDHRSVMMASIIACCQKSVSKVYQYQTVDKSYTDFFEDLKKLGGENYVKIYR